MLFFVLLCVWLVFIVFVYRFFHGFDVPACGFGSAPSQVLFGVGVTLKYRLHIFRYSSSLSVCSQALLASVALRRPPHAWTRWSSSRRRPLLCSAYCVAGGDERRERRERRMRRRRMRRRWSLTKCALAPMDGTGTPGPFPKPATSPRSAALGLPEFHSAVTPPFRGPTSAALPHAFQQNARLTPGPVAGSPGPVLAPVTSPSH